MNRSVAEIAQDPRFPAGTLIIGYQAHPHEDLVIPNGKTLLESDSTILAVTKPELVSAVAGFYGAFVGFRNSIILQRQQLLV